MTTSALSGPVSGLLCRLARLQDAVTRAVFVLAVIAAVVLTLVLAWEVVARYVLNSPTGWGPDIAGVSFALVTFCAAPMLAWKGGHANMNMVVQALPGRASIALQCLTCLMACAACWMVAWFGVIELDRLYTNKVMMITVMPIPKWWLMLAIVYAVLNMGMYYLRHAMEMLLCPASDAGTPGAP